MKANGKPASRLKTYSRLSHERRMPSDYELVTTDLLYYVNRGFEVTTPLREWYAKHQTGSPLTSTNWEEFVDPRETTYAKYVEVSRAREAYVDGVLQSIDDGGYDRALSSDWLRQLDAVLGPLRFPVHGFQMIASYVGQMAPSGRITVAAAFQSADELRRIQRIAYRMTQLKIVDANFGAEAREAWQNGSAWQPLREAIERCLTTYDRGEALVALNLCLKPIVDDLFMVRWPVHARQRDDFLLGQIFGSLEEDCRWHRDWTVALLAAAIRVDEGNRAVIGDWIRKWSDLSLRAGAALSEHVGLENSSTLADELARFHGRIGLEALRP